MPEKRFRKNDAAFTCAHCGAEVAPLGYSSRNHCPVGLWSLHLDENPGDRAADCGGQMRPIRVEPDPRKGYVIIHKCEKCGAIRRCKAAHEAAVQPDDIDLLIKLTAGEQIK